jgi:hypothetical protein
VSPTWRSPKFDPKSRTKLDDKTLQDLSAYADVDLHAVKPRPYFCSQLVPTLLVETGLLPSDAVDADITPTGLHSRLADIGWEDVTATDFGDEAIETMRIDNPARLECGNAFVEYRLHHQWSVDLMGLKLQRAAIEDGMARTTASIKAAQDRLDKLYGVTVPKES